MAETKLEIKSDGLEAIIAGFQKAVAEGDKLVATAEKIGEAQSATAQKAIQTQEQYNAGLRTTGKELKSISEINALGNLAGEADAQLRQVAKSIVDMGKKLVALGPEGKQAFGEIIKMMVNLEDVLKEGTKLQQKYADGLKEVGTGSADLINASLEATKESLAQNGKEISSLVENISASIFAEGLPEGGLPILQSILELKQELADLDTKAQALDVIGEQFEKQRASVEGNAEALARLNEVEKELAELREANAKAIERNTARQDELVATLEGLFATEQEAADASARASEEAAQADASRLESVNATAVAMKMQADASLSLAEATRLVADEAAKAGAEQVKAAQDAADAETSRKGIIEGTIESIKELDSAVKSAKTEQELAKANAELAEAKGNLQDLKKIGVPDFAPAEQVTKSFRQRLFEANQEVARIADQTGGRITPELVAAAEEAARLRSEMEDVNAVIQALDPSKKLAAFAALTQSIIGGFTAVSGLMALVGGEQGDKATETIAKMQSLLAVLQGANAFFDGLGKGLKALNGFVIANTTVTATNTAAKGANATASVALAGANTAAATSTGALTTGIRTLTAAMAANPILVAVGVLVGIAVALVALGDDARDSAEGAGELVAQLEKIQALNEKVFSNARRKQDLEDELRLLDEGTDAAGERLLVEQKFQNAQQEIRNKILDALDSEKQLQRQIDELRGTSNEDELAALKTYEAALKESQDKRAQLNQEGQLNQLAFDVQNKRAQEAIEEKAFAEAERRSKEAIARAKAEAAALLKAQEDYAKGVRQLSERLSDDLRSEQITLLQEQADKAEQQGQIEQARLFKDQIVAIQQQQGDELIAQSKRDLERKLAFIELERTMTVEALKGMTEDQRNALADTLIDSGKVQLAESEISKFNALVNLNAAQSQRERTKNAADEVAQRIALEKQETSEAIKSIDAFEAFSVAAAENEVGAERDKQRRILEIQIEAAKKKIAILEASGEIIDATEAEKLRTALAGAQKELDGLNKFSLKNIFNLSDADVQILTDAFNQVGSAIEAGFFAQIDLQREANEAYIDGLDERLAATREALDREAGFKEEGLANNYERERQNELQLLSLKEAAAKESERLAKKEQQAQRIVQIANLGSTIAQLLASEAKKGVIGIGIAAAAIPVLFSLFSRAKSTAQGAAFFQGTPFLELGPNPAGRDTIPIMANRGERIVPTKDNLQHWDLYEGLRTGNMEQLEKGLLDAIEHFGLTDLLDAFASKDRLPSLDMELPTRMVQQREGNDRLRSELAFDPVLRSMMENLTESNRVMMEDAISRVERVAIDGGYIEFHKGGKRKVKLTEPKG
jgi:colicin import membrane protein